MKAAGARCTAPLLFLGLGASLALYYFSASLWLAGIGALAFLVLACLRLDLALIYAVFSFPFYLFPKQFATLGAGSTGEPLAFSLVEFVVLVCTLAFLARTFLTREDNGTWGGLVVRLGDWRSALLPPLLLLLAATLSVAAAQESRPALREYRTVVIEPLLFYFLLLSVTDSQKKVGRFLLAFVALGLGVASFSLYHYFFVGEVEAAGGVGRLLAVYHSPNALALFLGRVAPLSLTLSLFGGGGKERWLHVLGSVAILAALYLTYSRGAWVAVVVALFFVAALRGKGWFLAGLAALAAAVLALLALLPVERLISSETSLQRLRLWKAALEMIGDQPVLGVGLDNFLYRYSRYMDPEAWAEPNLSHPHNIILDFWTRTGILGMMSMAWLQVVFWRGSLGLYRRLAPGPGRAAALGLMASMVGFLVHGFIDNSFFLIDLAFIFWLTYGLVIAMSAESRMISADR